MSKLWSPSPHVPSTLTQPLRWRKPTNVFVDGELFGGKFHDEDIMAVLGAMVVAPKHNFIVTTRFPDHLRETMEKISKRESSAWLADPRRPNHDHRVLLLIECWGRRIPGIEFQRNTISTWPLPNVDFYVRTHSS